jgi:hypothetical protein
MQIFLKAASIPKLNFLLVQKGLKPLVQSKKSFWQRVVPIRKDFLKPLGGLFFADLFIKFPPTFRNLLIWALASFRNSFETEAFSEKQF